LYPPGLAPTNVVPPADADIPVVAETYDECVFTDPTEAFYQQLLRLSNLDPVPLKEPRVQAALGQFSDERDFQLLLEAQKFLQFELVTVRERLQLIDSEMSQIDDNLRQAQEKTRSKKTPRGISSSKKKG
jgi:hypothetical protein